MALLLKDIRRWVLAVVLLSFSQAFFDFTSSGLEYPLIYFLSAIFVLLYLRDQHIADKYSLALSAGLLLITRHDTLMLIAPMLIHLAWRYQKTLPIKQKIIVATLFISPLALWTLFSLLYYGMPLPNTAYGKLNIDGISRIARLERGWIYLSKSLLVDPITPIAIFLITVRGLCSQQILQRMVSASVALAMAYITWIGADYMLGRFYAPLYLVAILLFTQQTWRGIALTLPIRVAIGISLAYLAYYFFLANLQIIADFFKAMHWPDISPTAAIVVLAIIGLVFFVISVVPTIRCQRISKTLLIAILLFSSQQFDSPWQTRYKNWGKNSDFDMWWNMNNVSRERYFIYHWTSLYAWFHRDPNKLFPDHPWCREGAAAASPALIAFDGMSGYCMGTDKIAIDIKALTDPLLARMPKNPGAPWSSGGVNRYIPAGYIESVATGENRIADPDLAQYYDKLKLLTSSDTLFSWERLQTIVAFHWGSYDHWLRAYIARIPPTQHRTHQTLNAPRVVK
jgi:hypothetical protein